MRHILIMAESCEVRVTKQRPQRKVVIQRCDVPSTSLIVLERSIKIFERSSIVFPQDFFFCKTLSALIEPKIWGFLEYIASKLKKGWQFFFKAFQLFSVFFQFFSILGIFRLQKLNPLKQRVNMSFSFSFSIRF